MEKTFQLILLDMFLNQHVAETWPNWKLHRLKVFVWWNTLNDPRNTQMYPTGSLKWSTHTQAKHFMHWSWLWWLIPSWLLDIPPVLLLLSHWIMFDSLWPNKLQLSSLPCPSLSPRVCSNSCPLSWQCCLTISSSVKPFSSCPQSFPASESFLVTLQLFTSGDQIIRALASVSILPMNIQGWFS